MDENDSSANIDAPVSRRRIDVSLPREAREDIWRHQQAFAKYRRLHEAALEGTGLRQADIMELIGDEILEDVVRECAAETDGILQALSQSLLGKV